ncbi:MAG: extracellular solute-binding protein [Parcubacteria group bacterium]
MNKKISVAAFLLILLITFSGCGCKAPTSSYQVSLEVWGLFDDSDVMAKVINEYKKRNTFVKEINYKKLTVDSYENDLRDALASGKGPDIFLIHNSWLSKHKDKLAPAPDSVINAKQIQDAFVDVVSQDFVRESKVYALPLSADSLALYYNKDLLNQAGISVPPKTWLEFDDAVKKITKIDTFGNIVVSGAAMGSSSDASAGEGKINRATDILTAIMMQAGAEMYDAESNTSTFAKFANKNISTGNQIPPGQAALNYYTKFSNRDNLEYSWNSTMHNSVDSFIEGQTAMTLNYSWLLPRIQSKAPKLNLGISTLPQNIDANGKGLNLNFANYWGFAVSNNKVIESGVDSGVSNAQATNDQRIGEAWRFIRYLTMPPSYSQDADFKAAQDPKYDPAAEYAAEQKKPAARRDIIETQKSDILMAPFAEGNLVAKSWPQPDNLAVERIFDEMIDDVALRNADSRKSIEQAQKDVDLLIKKDSL